MCGLGCGKTLSDQVAVDWRVAGDSEEAVGLQLEINSLEDCGAIFDGSDEAVVGPDFDLCGAGALDGDCGVHGFPFVVVAYDSSV